MPYFVSSIREKTKTLGKMKTYNTSTEDTLVTFHTSGGGGNRTKTVYCDQDTPINDYTDDLFLSYENESKISEKIGNRENLRSLFEKAREGNKDAIDRIELITGIEFGDQIYTDDSGNDVGLMHDNDGTGTIDIDGWYDTTTVCRLKECGIDDLKKIYNSTNYKSSDVEEYCLSALIEAGEIEEESEDKESEDEESEEN